MSIAVPSRRSRSTIEPVFRRLLAKAGAKLQRGRLTIEYPDGSADAFGQPEAKPAATLRILDGGFYKKVLFDGEIGLGEAYMDGMWEADDLTELLKLVILNRKRQHLKLWSWVSWLSKFRNRQQHVGRQNTVQMSRENIHDHYDLGNDFFELFLDESMTYSCGVFPRGEESLHEAQMHKYEAIAGNAELKRGERVLEIGSGWGGFAAYMARERGCKVTTISISDEQVKLARRRIEEAGLSDDIDVELLDYRNVEGVFDKIVSIEMFEAVGAEYFETFFRACDSVLRPGGLISMQIITVPDRDFPAQKKGVNWLNKHIFPGGVLPSIGAIEEALGPTSLLIRNVADIGPNYTITLRRWRERFFDNLPAVRDMGFTDVFIRKWDYYLSSCEAAFATRLLGDIQIVLEKRAT